MLRITLLGLSVLLLGSVQAAVLTVTNADDSGAGSLREALNTANASAGAAWSDLRLNRPKRASGRTARTRNVRRRVSRSLREASGASRERIPGR